MMGEGAWCYYRYKRHCRKAQDRRMQSGSTAGFSRLQLYLYSGRRNLPSPVGWSQKDGASGGGLGCKEKLLQQHWKQLQQSADGSGFGQGQVCSSSAQGCALLVRSHPGKKLTDARQGRLGSDSPRLARSSIFSLQSLFIWKSQSVQGGWVMWHTLYSDPAVTWADLRMVRRRSVPPQGCTCVFHRHPSNTRGASPRIPSPQPSWPLSI